MTINKKTKLHFSLIIACTSFMAQATLGDWLKDTGVVGVYYAQALAKETITHFGSVNPKAKLITVALLSCCLLKATYNAKRMENAPNKFEKKKIEKEHGFALAIANSFKYQMTHIATIGKGCGHYCSALVGEKIAISTAQKQQSSGIMFGEGTPSFSPTEKVQIESVVSQMGLDPSKFIVLKQEGIVGSALGASKGGIIRLGSELCKHPDKMKYILGHEATHLKKNHAKKAAIAGVLIPIGVEVGCALLQYGTAKLIEKLKRNYKIKKNSHAAWALSWIKHCTDTLASSIVLKGVMSFYLWHVYCRRQEKEADLESVRTLNCAQAAIDCCEDMRISNLKYKESSNSEEFDKQGNYLADLTHPSYNERIAYLKPLAEEQAQGV